MRLKATAFVRRTLQTMRGAWLAVGASGLFAALLAFTLLGVQSDAAFGSLELVAQLHWGMFFVMGAGAAAVLLGLCLLWNSQAPLTVALPTLVLCYALLQACNTESNVLFSLGLCVPVLLAVRWALGQMRTPLRKTGIPLHMTHVFAWMLFLVFTVVMAYGSILRYRVYVATNFDLGIFAQMFEMLRKTGHAFTTLERNQLMTHFGVHCSPIYYLLLPLYMLCPRIETLLVLQAAAVGAGVFAVRGIAQHLFGPSPRLIMCSCFVYIIHPALMQGLLYDFHENKFLAVLVLFALLFALKQKPLPMLLFAALLLSVKEDASIYVVSLALFLLVFCRWKHRRTQQLAGIAMLAGSVAWFLCAMAIVRRYGSGVMVDRLSNFFLPGEGDHGLADVIKVCLSDLAYVIQQAFSAEKTKFLLWVLLPLGFAPLLHKKGGAWLLLLPLLVINLLSNYGYQHEIGYQYVYGSVPLALGLGLLALQKLQPRARRTVLVLAACGGLLCTLPLTAPRLWGYLTTMQKNPDRIQAVDTILAALPLDEEITATTCFAVHLYQRDNVYMYPNFFDDSRVTPWLVCKPEEVDENEALRQFIEENGYVQQQEQAFVRVYYLQESNDKL
ncbi:MAG: DUF2079 domain-containing protein [Oscillospiraceae bacterium]|jgi:uncharacterized membrane protein|nr:DUF2079 domain-containing protein [Oscillospiraceae bacterium]